MTMALYLIGAVAIISIIGGGIWKIHHSGYVAGKAEIQGKWDAAVAEQRAKEQKASEAATTKLEVSNAKARVVYRTITRNVDRYIDRPIYREHACFDSDGLRDAQAALSGSIPAPDKPDKRVSRPNATR